MWCMIEASTAWWAGQATPHKEAQVPSEGEATAPEDYPLDRCFSRADVTEAVEREVSLMHAEIVELRRLLRSQDTLRLRDCDARAGVGADGDRRDGDRGAAGSSDGGAGEQGTGRAEAGEGYLPNASRHSQACANQVCLPNALFYYCLPNALFLLLLLRACECTPRCTTCPTPSLYYYYRLHLPNALSLSPYLVGKSLSPYVHLGVHTLSLLTYTLVYTHSQARANHARAFSLARYFPLYFSYVNFSRKRTLMQKAILSD